MATFITKLDATGDGPRVAVKDIIDVVGVPTTAGCRAVEQTAAPAEADAACLAGARAAGARLVGKANLHELAMLPVGTNPWFGTPVNPLDPDLIPGGSSSGCAVAVATGEADVAFGSDTGGSIRVPSACCGTVGLKTTYGRVSRRGMLPFCASLDHVGVLASTVPDLAASFDALHGHDPADPASAERPREDSASLERGIDGLRLAVAGLYAIFVLAVLNESFEDAGSTAEDGANVDIGLRRLKEVREVAAVEVRGK